MLKDMIMPDFLFVILFAACLFLKIKISALEKETKALKHLKDRLACMENKVDRLSDRVDALIHRENRGETGIGESLEPAIKTEPDRKTFETGNVPRETPTKKTTVSEAAMPKTTETLEKPPAGPFKPIAVPLPPPLPEIDDEIPAAAFMDAEPVSKASQPEPPEKPAFAKPQPRPVKNDGLFSQWESFKKNVDWELFTGTKLFAWLGVFALFIGILFFVKLSMDRGWFPPALRLSLGAVTGIILCLYSVKKMSDRLALLKHTLAAAGVGVLYSVVFAATLYYDYLPKTAGFLLLSLITATAFVLAVFHRALSISVLGAVGAFMTPVLVNTGGGSLPMLFLYLALVNTGLYLVMTRLDAPVLLLIGAGGTLLTLGLGTFETFHATSGYEAGGVWTANTVLFSLYLCLQRHLDPDETRSLLGTGMVIYLSALVSAVGITLFKPGWMPLFLITAAACGALTLSWFQKGWYLRLVPYTALSFAAALFWTFLKFDVQTFSPAFVLIFLYGAVGCLGPLVLLRKYGPTPSLILWFKRFPMAVSALCLAGLFKNPSCSFLFWPIILGVQVMGLFVSVLFRAIFQVLILIALFVAGGLFWMFHIPQDGMGLVFFIFILFSGFLLTGLIVLAAGKLPGILRALNMNETLSENGLQNPAPFEPWLTAAPSTGISILLGAAFMVPFPHFPNPGMATLCCFLVLALFFSRRIQFEPSAVLTLLSALFAQAVWVLLPHSGLILTGADILEPALFWAGGLFIAALLAPFLFYRNHGLYKKTWNAFAVFEVVQFLFFLVSARLFFSDPLTGWLPLIPALAKLPLVALLLKQLEGKPVRNAILAFHGGVLLFYISALPVLLLDHGWLGLALVVEATALIWLNTRIEHPGLKKVASVMSPVGLVLLVIHLPLLKTADSLKIVNPAILSMAATVLAISAAVRLLPDGERRPGRLTFSDYYRWLALFSGFFLINLTVADVFAPTCAPFRILPDGSFIQSSAYALSWVLFGAMLWKSRALPPVMRKTGFFILGAGALFLIVLPAIMPRSIIPMNSFFNTALVTYAAMLALLFFVFYTEPYDDKGNLVKNVFLALFLSTLFMMIKTLKSTLLQNGGPFTLISEHTARHALASVAALFLYGTGLLIWPRRLDRPFRLAGLVLLFAALAKSARFPLIFSAEFGHMTPVLNGPTLLYLFLLAMLIYFSMRTWKEPWPLDQIRPRPLWPLTFAVFAFYVMNVEIASLFGRHGFTFSPDGNWGKSFGYSLGWLFFAIGLLVAGIRLQSKRTRWAAIILLCVTAGKIFFSDLWALGQLYRVGSFIGLAVVLILVSYLYQRFIAEETGEKENHEPENEETR
jgi:uncharacterized membrane protein